MMGLQAMCFWVIMTYNVMMYEVIYEKKRYDYQLGVVLD